MIGTMQRRDVFKFTALAASAATIEAQEQRSANVAAPPAAAWKPEAMDAHQSETLAVLGDLIIPDTDTPGARAANVHRYIDLILRDGPAERREEVLSGLNWLDGYAIGKYSKSFVKCSKEEQTAILTALDEGREPAGSRFFRDAKRLVASVYYNTAIGFRELNKGGRVPKTFGCQA